MLRRVFKRANISLMLLAALAIGGATAANAATIPMKTSDKIVADMGVGWNLGNDLDSRNEGLVDGDPSEYELNWGNPVATKAMIDKIKEGGFKTVRIPTSWIDHMGPAPEYKVNEAWMNRVQEVVDYCIDDGLYVILDIHHEGDWCIPKYANEEAVSDKLGKLWTQIATHFKDYDDHLIFDEMNEVREIGDPLEWAGGTDEGRDVINKYHTVALNAIRTSGGNNDERAVMLSTYAASNTQVSLDSLASALPKDDKHIMVSIHSYAPYNFAMNCGDGSVDYCGSEEDKKALTDDFDRYVDTFVSKGVPVVIGEFGTVNKDNEQVRARWEGFYVAQAKQRGIACVRWDNNQPGPAHNWETFGLFDRTNLNFYFPEIRNYLINSYNDAPGYYK